MKKCSKPDFLDHSKIGKPYSIDFFLFDPPKDQQRPLNNQNQPKDGANKNDKRQAKGSLGQKKTTKKAKTSTATKRTVQVQQRESKRLKPNQIKRAQIVWQKLKEKNDSKTIESARIDVSLCQDMREGNQFNLIRNLFAIFSVFPVWV